MWIVGLLLAWLVGLAAMRLLAASWSPRGLKPALPLAAWMEHGLIALGAGLGLCAAAEFFVLLLAPNQPVIWTAVQVVMLSAAIVVLRHAWLQAAEPKLPALTPRWPRTWEARLSGAAAIVVASLLVAGVVSQALMMPHGSWDAWAVWNLKARMLLLSDAGVHSVFDEAMLFSHRDYPLLVPLTVARLWRLEGWASTTVMLAVSLTWLSLLIGLLGAAVWRRRGLAIAAAAVLMLLALPWFVEEAGVQLADIPLALFMLASAVAITQALARRATTGHWMLVGLLASCAAMTKNEGLVWAAGVAMITLAAALRWRSCKPLACALGASPFILALAIQKLWLFGRTDVIEVFSVSRTLTLVSDWSRHEAIARELHQRVADNWPFACALVAALLAMAALGFTRRRQDRVTAAALALLILWQAGGYWLAYLISPHEINWHLEESMHRLILQLWPVTLFIWAMALDRPARPDHSPVCSAAQAGKPRPAGST